MSSVSPNHVKTMYYTSLYRLVELGRILLPIFKMAAILD